MNNNETENTDTAEIDKTSIFNMKKDDEEGDIEEKEKTDCPAITCVTLFVILLLSGAAFAFFMIIMFR